MIPLCWYHHARCYEARVHGSCLSSLRIFFCRQRKRRRVKGKTFFVAETQCQVIIYGKGGQLFPWQEQTFNSRGRARSTRRIPRCVTIATYMKETIYPIACEQALHRVIVKSRPARGTREETRKRLGPTQLRRSLAHLARIALLAQIGRLARRLPIPWNCVVMWVSFRVFLIICITSFETSTSFPGFSPTRSVGPGNEVVETSPIRNIKKDPYKEMPGFRDTRLVAQGYQLQILVSLLRCSG